MTQTRNVEDRLREMILEMELGPGERLTERGAEDLLGASRTPVRAALLRLETEGLVRREGRGWMVAPLDLQEIEQLFVYREILEVAAVRLAITVGDEAALARLEALLASIGTGTSREGILRAGRDFHVEFARLSGNAFIVHGIADAMTRLSRARWLEADPTHHGWAEHRAMLAALRAGDVAEAVNLTERHVRQTRDRVLRALRDGRRSLRARGAAVG
jgi:DNA-binding GntR family transcriptional regulator